MQVSKSFKLSFAATISQAQLTLSSDRHHRRWHVVRRQPDYATCDRFKQVCATYLPKR
ncbi:hypothetical protein IQ272_00105 [Chroococcidiopsidales cyanobacterium LEGE 13417]|uniref:hypothetical protein n=1 Tax=Chroococcidiopsis sp. CCALA 051 TaxID=869949 RepID=UPI001304D353|nr:hypothetical protein [Chroococcidiopsis sp. CCALA 051]MBE9014583.1 hypothetical protein [Chroococcidiopsidales cyanobacterium LEGE 13417]